MKEKIEEFRSLGRKEAKAALENYAKEEFGISLNKQRSFDNMVIDLEAELAVRGIDTDLSASDEAEVQTPASEPEVVEPAGDVVEQPEPEVTPAVETPAPAAPVQSSYIQVPYWIYDWIKENPDWKEKTGNCKFYGSKKVLETLKQRIKQDGHVMIRETRNSRFELIS